MKKSLNAFMVCALIGAGTLFYACTPKNQKQFADMEFNTIKVKEALALAPNDSLSPRCSLNITYTYPEQAKDSALVAGINKELQTLCLGETYRKFTPGQAIETYRDNYLAEYKKNMLPLYQEELKKQHKDEALPGWYSCYKDMELQPITDHPDYLVFRMNMSEFSGGAHGNHSTMFYNFDTAGRLLQLDDLFKPGYQGRLTELLLIRLMELQGVTTLEELQEKAYLQMNDMYPSENFHIKQTGILFFYNQYEIAPYSNGVTELTLTNEELKNILK